MASTLVSVFLVSGELVFKVEVEVGRPLTVCDLKKSIECGSSKIPWYVQELSRDDIILSNRTQLCGSGSDNRLKLTLIEINMVSRITEALVDAHARANAAYVEDVTSIIASFLSVLKPAVNSFPGRDTLVFDHYIDTGIVRSIGWIFLDEDATKGSGKSKTTWGDDDDITVCLRAVAGFLKSAVLAINSESLGDDVMASNLFQSSVPGVQYQLNSKEGIKVEVGPSSSETCHELKLDLRFHTGVPDFREERVEVSFPIGREMSAEAVGPRLKSWQRQPSSAPACPPRGGGEAPATPIALNLAPLAAPRNPLQPPRDRSRTPPRNSSLTTRLLARV